MTGGIVLEHEQEIALLTETREALGALLEAGELNWPSVADLCKRVPGPDAMLRPFVAAIDDLTDPFENALEAIGESIEGSQDANLLELRVDELDSEELMPNEELRRAYRRAHHVRQLSLAMVGAKIEALDETILALGLAD